MKHSKLLLLLLTIILFFPYLPALQPALGSDVPPAATGAHKGKLYFSFISSAYYMEKNWGHGMPFDGIKKTAEVAHQNGIPVTWLVNARSALEGKDIFTDYHNRYGDEMGYIVSGSDEEAKIWGGEAFYLQQMSEQKLSAFINKELAEIRGNLPWANIVIAGSGYRSNKMVKIFERLGFKALWGHCWEQTLTDGISDRGSPWGFFYISHDAFKAPAHYDGGLVAIEWTARDLNRAFRTGSPETYSTDPNDVLRNNLCTHREIAYWKNFVDEYERNTAYNRMVPLMVHQEAHEMECTDRICAYNDEQIASTYDMLDELFKYVKSKGAVIVPASAAVEAYRQLNPSTPPTFALFRDIVPKADKTYPEIFVYFDTNGQLFFDRGRTDPIFIRNYLGKLEVRTPDFAAVALPMAVIDKKQQDKTTTFTAAITSKEKTAYGLAFWGDYSKYQVETNPRALVKILDDQLLFVGIPVEKGTTILKINLKPK